MFIPDHLKPQSRSIAETSLYLIFNFEGYLEPSEEATRKALSFYNEKIVQRTFDRLMQYHLHKSQKRKYQTDMESKAVEFYNRRNVYKKFKNLKDLTSVHRRRRIVACSLLRHVQQQIICRGILHTWNATAADSRKTREYFEVRHYFCRIEFKEMNC